MLSRADNELLTRVGPGTPMGALMRQYWIPALLTEELSAPDCRPVRLRLLGEDLVAFRASDGCAGILRQHCPHRGASLFFGRNEESGLRCVYHGWKFDVNGRCVDMPNEPEGLTYPPAPSPRGKGRTVEARCSAPERPDLSPRAVAYPCVERNGLIWTYMGPRREPPPLPDLEWNLVPQNIPFIWQSYRACNWLQALEGDLDDAHIHFLHGGARAARGASALGPRREPEARQTRIVDTEVGVLSLVSRRETSSTCAYRLQPFFFPFHTMIGGGLADRGQRLSVHAGKAWVPMDDGQTLALDWLFRPGEDWQAGTARPWSPEERAELLRARMPLGFREPTTQAVGAWRPVASLENDYCLDPELQRTARFCGILGNPTQDAAVQESMGAIVDRTAEHLDSTDALLVRVRKRLLEAARALQERGAVPPGAEQPERYRLSYCID